MSKGKEKLTESLSALMDNETNEFEFRRILKECESSPELKQTWERYHVLSAVIRGELDNGLNVGSCSTDKRPDLLSRINAELDGLEGSNEEKNSTAAYIEVEGSNFASAFQLGMFKRLGQGAIAASVAAVVFIAGGSLNPLLPQENELQFAQQSGVSDELVPEFDDAYSPSEFSRVPQLFAEFTETEAADEAARVRLRQAVFQEFVGEPQDSVELPVNFNVIIEAEDNE